MGKTLNSRKCVHTIYNYTHQHIQLKHSTSTEIVWIDLLFSNRHYMQKFVRSKKRLVSAFFSFTCAGVFLQVDFLHSKHCSFFDCEWNKVVFSQFLFHNFFLCNFFSSFFSIFFLYGQSLRTSSSSMMIMNLIERNTHSQSTKWKNDFYKLWNAN